MKKTGFIKNRTKISRTQPNYDLIKDAMRKEIERMEVLVFSTCNFESDPVYEWAYIERFTSLVYPMEFRKNCGGKFM